MRHFLLLLLAPLLVMPAWGQAALTPAEEAEHVALRKLKSDISTAISKRDFDGVKKVMHEPFMATVITQDSFTQVDQLKQYYEHLLTRPALRIKDIAIVPEADELSKIMTGTFALTRGSTAERYVMADGRSFDMKGRWTAISFKEPDGSWKLLAVHTGVNFLDNPVLDAIEQSVMWSGTAGVGCGLALGLLAGWFIWRRGRH